MKNEIPSALEDHLGYWLRCLSNLVSDSFAKRLEKYGVSVAQWVVLRIFYDQTKPLILVEAAKLVGVDKSSLSRMIDRLVQKHLIIKSSNDEDLRSAHLTLSEKGRGLVLSLAAEADANDRSFFQSLSKSEKAEFLDLIQRLLNKNGWSPSKDGRVRMT